MRDEEMPDHGLESFGVGRDVVWIYCRHDHACVGDLSRVAAILADDSDHN